MSGICRLDDVSIMVGQSGDVDLWKVSLGEKVMDGGPKQAKKEEHELANGFKGTQNPKESRKE